MFDEEFASIPSDLDEMKPSPELAAVLAGIDVDRLSGYDRIRVLRAEDRMASHYQARRYRTVASVVDVMEDDELRFAAEGAAAELQAALRLTRRASEGEVEFALALRQRLPGVWDALAAGEIDLRRARLLWHRTVHLSTAAARNVVERLIEAAPRLTTGQLRVRVDRLCLEADPRAADDRYRHWVEERRVVPERTDNGTANLLGLELPPHLVAAITRKINRLARNLNSAGDSRTMDQLRADVFLDLLLENHRSSAGADKAVVDIQVDLDTLVALAAHPGELNGFGPVIADIARQVTEEQEDAEWRYTVTDTASNHTLTGITRRRPSRSQRRHVEVRDRTCIFPGCRMPAIDCDLDHEIRWADGGLTCIDKLAAVCRHHHVIRHRHRWKHRPLPNGDHQWTSPLGHRYTTSGLPP